MMGSSWKNRVLIIGLVLMITTSCKKEEETPEPYSGEFVTDIDGNVYHTVTIGNQVWMLENLKTSKYRNGEPIPNVIDSIEWVNLKSGAFCNYDNDTVIGNEYGKLYNWYAITDSRNIAPIGWHVPTSADWDTLGTYLGGVSFAGDKIKEKGTTHWNNPNPGATNESGFTALAAGIRSYEGNFRGLGEIAVWRIPAEGEGANIISVWRNFTFINWGYGGEKNPGMSVRCIKNLE